MMLRHLELHGKAALIENALLTTLESGIHTSDFGSSNVKPCSTAEFAQAVISNLGATPQHNPSTGKDSVYTPPPAHSASNTVLESPRPSQAVVGIDLFVESNEQPHILAHSLQEVLSSSYKLTLISNRGTQVWPTGSVLTDCVNQYRVRVELAEGAVATERDLLSVALQIAGAVRVCSTEMLMNYREAPAYSLAQGQ